MICDTCRCIVPEHHIACPNCLLRKNEEAMRVFQYVPLIWAAEGRLMLKARRFNHSIGALHIQMFGPGTPEQTFCRQMVERKHKLVDLDWRDLDSTATLCRDCRQEVRRYHRLATEAAVA